MARPVPAAERPVPRPGQRPSWFMVPVYLVAIIALVVAVVAGSRVLAAWAAPVLYLWSDGDHLRLTVYLVVLWASLVPWGFVARRAQRRFGRWRAAPAWVVVVGLGLLLFGFVPGRNNGGRLSRELSLATGGTLTDTGDIYVGTALAGLIGLGLVVPLLAIGVLGDKTFGQAGAGRLVLGALLYVAGWVGAGAVVLATVGDTPARITWLEETAEVLPGGDAGVTGGFHIGLDTSVVEVVDCDDAAAALRVDSEVPELEGCRRGLLVAATGRYERDGRRVGSGELVAVVVQVRTEDQLTALRSDLDAVELVASGGLPPAPGELLVSPAPAALSLVIASEDTGEIPLPADGAGQRPLTRALAYVVTGSAVGFYLGPPEETPVDAAVPGEAASVSELTRVSLPVTGSTCSGSLTLDVGDDWSSGTDDPSAEFLYYGLDPSEESLPRAAASADCRLESSASAGSPGDVSWGDLEDSADALGRSMGPGTTLSSTTLAGLPAFAATNSRGGLYAHFVIAFTAGPDPALVTLGVTELADDDAGDDDGDDDDEALHREVVDVLGTASGLTITPS